MCHFQVGKSSLCETNYQIATFSEAISSMFQYLDNSKTKCLYNGAFSTWICITNVCSIHDHLQHRVLMILLKILLYSISLHKVALVRMVLQCTYTIRTDQFHRLRYSFIFTSTFENKSKSIFFFLAYADSSFHICLMFHNNVLIFVLKYQSKDLMLQNIEHCCINLLNTCIAI